MKKKLIYRTWFKFLSFVLLVLSSLIFLTSLVSIIYMYEEGIYYKTYEEYVGEIYSSYSEYDGQDFYIDISGAEEAEFTVVSPEEYVYYDSNFSEQLKYARLFYEIRYLVVLVAIVSVIVAAASFVVLLCSAGHNGEGNEITHGWDSIIWFDVQAGIAAFVTIYSMYLMLESVESYSFIPYFVFCCCFLAVLEIVDTGVCMSFAARVKNGNWWKGTFIYNCLYRPLIWLGGIMLRTIQRIPFVWGASIGIFAFFFINMMMICLDGYERDNMLIFWIIQALIIIPLVIYIFYQGKKLKVATEHLSLGDLGYKLDTRGMYSTFRENAENLNRISDGISKALDERVKSERMKTELISNVSHDIKTPLTSLINYTDLIMREDCDNEKIKEYSQVLHKNAERLKRLMEDIIEASKASSGAMDINLEPCDAGIVLSQIAGEYEEKLSQAKLTLILKEPEENLSILADSRRLWRVFDNVFNNICKYSMPESRVYVTLSREGENIVFTFKNTSQNELDINPDELMERFVRADASRKTEGNGLGLSIAKSLTELQKGAFNISIDGDLFKVTISFPYIENP